MANVAQIDHGPGGEERNIVDRDICALTTGYSAETIRKRCRPCDYDPDTGRALYDRDAVLVQLRAAGVQPRPDTRRPRRRGA
jgi:hypothetical protein